MASPTAATHNPKVRVLGLKYHNFGFGSPVTVTLDRDTGKAEVMILQPEDPNLRIVGSLRDGHVDASVGCGRQHQDEQQRHAGECDGQSDGGCSSAVRTA